MKHKDVLSVSRNSTRWGLLLILGLFIGLPAFSQVAPSPQVGDELYGGIVVSYDARTGNVLVLHKDESDAGTMSWADAGTWAGNVAAGGWRLPSLHELEEIYRLYKDNRLGNAIAFENAGYWSGSERDGYGAWSVDFFDGDVSGFGKGLYFYRARAVRAFNLFADLTLSEPAGLAAGNSAEVVNTIVYGHEVADMAKDIRVMDDAQVSYSATATAPTGTGNINMDENDFADYAAEDYLLAETSALLNQGNGSAVPADYALDLRGVTRRAYGSVDPGAWQVGKGTPPAPSVYHTVTLTLAPGIWCDHQPGDLVIAEGEHLYPQFRVEDPLLTAGDILFLVDGVETAFKTSPDGTGGSYILSPINKDHTLLIALREYPVTMPAVDGAVTDPAAGEHKVPYGEPFRFTIDLNDPNDLEDLKVLVNGIELTPDETGHALSLQQYTIDAITEPVNITIEGVNPTGNMEISTNSFNIYVSDGMLVAESPSATLLSVYTVAGQLRTARTIPAGTTRIALPQGVYIVQIGTEVYKVVVN